MKRKQIIIAASIAVLAIIWTGVFWSKFAWPLLRRGFERSDAGVPRPPFEVEVHRNILNRPRQIPPAEEIAGIGAVLRMDNDSGQLLVMNTVPGSPAERAGLKAGMIIQKVDDTSLAAMQLAECINLIRGPVGSKVRIEVRDPDQNTVIQVELIRERLQLGGR
jgi:S1-C subfamily serine protease